MSVNKTEEEITIFTIKVNEEGLHNDPYRIIVKEFKLKTEVLDDFEILNTETKMTILLDNQVVLDISKDAGYFINHSNLLNINDFGSFKNYEKSCELIVDFYTDLKAVFPSELDFTIQVLKEGRLYPTTTWKSDLNRKYLTKLLHLREDKFITEVDLMNLDYVSKQFISDKYLKGLTVIDQIFQNLRTGDITKSDYRQTDYLPGCIPLLKTQTESVEEVEALSSRLSGIDRVVDKISRKYEYLVSFKKKTLAFQLSESTDLAKATFILELLTKTKNLKIQPENLVLILTTVTQRYCDMEYQSDKLSLSCQNSCLFQSHLLNFIVRKMTDEAQIPLKTFYMLSDLIIDTVEKQLNYDSQQKYSPEFDNDVYDSLINATAHLHKLYLAFGFSEFCENVKQCIDQLILKFTSMSLKLINPGKMPKGFMKYYEYLDIIIKGGC